MLHMGYEARKVRPTNNCPPKKFWFTVVFDRNSPVKNFRLTTLSDPVNCYVANAGNQHANGSYKCVRENEKMGAKARKRSGQKGMSNLFRKN